MTGAALLPAAAPAHAAYCEGPHRRTVAETGDVRVYEVTRGKFEDRVIACLKRNGTKSFLWYDGATGTEIYFVNPIRIKGPLVAFGEGTLGREYNQGTAVVVVDVRTRRSVYSRRERDGTRIRDLELTRGGSVAWIAEDGAGNYPVRRYDALGEAELDDGAGVDPESLTLEAGELHWAKNGEPRSAPILEAARTCRPRPRHHTIETLAANELVRVYKVVDSWDHEPGFEDTGDVYACDRATGWRRKIGFDGAYPDLYEVHARVEGRLVAYSFGCSSCREQYRMNGRIAVLDMGTRRHTFTHQLEGDGFVTDLVLKPGGSIGWIGMEFADYVVRRHDAGGLAELDRGDAIDPDSLTLDDGSVLHWVNGGQGRSAPLD